MKAFVMLMLLFSTSLYAEEQLLPVDESKADASFYAFKQTLLKDVKAKNVAGIKSILADNVTASFGGDSDIKSFIAHYKLNDKNSYFWAEFEKVLNLGCTRNDLRYTCPYVTSKWPEKYDSYSYVAVIKAKTPIRVKPQASAAVIRTSDYEILKVKDHKAKGWYTVTLDNGKVGYVRMTDARSSGNHRALFNKLGKDWKLTHFVAGD